MGKKLVAKAWIDSPYIHNEWIADKSEMVITIHIPVKTHSEIVHSS